jgi:MoxR-like ATPase
MSKPSPAQVLLEWLERDLTAVVSELPAAFQVEDLLDQIVEVIESGRHPVLSGEPGVGKTAAVYELVRRAAAGAGPPSLAGRRVIQISFRHRLSGLRGPRQIAPETQKLVEALLAEGDRVVPFFRDLHLAHLYDLEPQLSTLATRFPGAILAEGERTTLAAMLESSPEIGERYLLVTMEEPDLDRTERLLAEWSAEQARLHGRRFETDALTEALHLTHRFLPRTRLPRKVLDLLGQVAALAGGGPVTADHVLDRFCRSHKVPRVLVDPALPLDLSEVDRRLTSEVLGQAEAVAAVVRMIGMMKAGLSDVRRPFGVFLFVGPTGVGKTHLAQILAEFLFGGRERMIRINLADFQKEGAAELLFGTPDGFSVVQRRGVLTLRVLGQPFAVLLLDEFEKAHPTVHDRFLQLVDEGCFINGAGETVSCRSMILIATSNAGADVYRGHLLGFRDGADLAALDAEAHRRLLERFRFEFLNRFDQVVRFRPLSREDIRTIALRELTALKERPGLRRRGLGLEVDDAVLDWLAINGYDPHYGARVLRRTIEREVAVPLAEAVVRGRFPPGTQVELTVRRNRVVARAASPAAASSSVAVAPAVRAGARPRSPAGLAKQADTLLASAAGRLAALEARKEERSALLARLNESGIWEASAEGRALIARYGELDVTIRAEERLAVPLRHLARVRAEGGTDAAALGAALGSAARALGDWDDRLAEDGAGGVWLVIRPVDALRPAGEWLADLATLELAWCRRLLLMASIAGYHADDGQLGLVALDVEGPGAGTYLTMERGLHRLHRARGPGVRARVDLVPKGPAPASDAPSVAAVRRRKGLLGLDVGHRGILRVESRGLTIELAGPDAAVLAHLLADLARAWSADEVEPAEPARVYGEDGQGARDPRTGAVVARMKQVLRGQLDPLLEAWRRRA